MLGLHLIHFSKKGLWTMLQTTGRLKEKFCISIQISLKIASKHGIHK